MRREIVVALFLAVAAVSPAAAQGLLDNKFAAFATIGSGFGDSVTGGTAIGTLGFRPQSWASVGAEIGALSHKPFDGASSEKSVVGRYVNITARLEDPEFGRFRPYALGGVGWYTADRGDTTRTSVDTAFGVGANYWLSRWIGVGAEQRLFIVNGGSTSAPTKRISRFSVGVTIAAH